ncbi:unnamed protein product, partial [Ectocarpus sp. 12 AP-2014]
IDRYACFSLAGISNRTNGIQYCFSVAAFSSQCLEFGRISATPVYLGPPFTTPPIITLGAAYVRHLHPKANRVLCTIDYIPPAAGSWGRRPRHPPLAPATRPPTLLNAVLAVGGHA